MAPRPHPVVLASLVLGSVLVLALVMPRGASGADWRWPLRGPVVGAFHAVAGCAVRARAAPRHRSVGGAWRRRARRVRGSRDASPGRCRVAAWRSACAAARCRPPTSGWAGSRCARDRASPPASGLGMLGSSGPPAPGRAPRRRPPRLSRPADPAGRRASGAPAPRSGAARAAPSPHAPGGAACGGARRHPSPWPPDCRGPPTRRWRSWPPRFPSAAWCVAAVGGAPRSRTEHGPPPTRRRRPADAL